MLFTTQTLKYRSVLAFCHHLFSLSEEAFLNGKGEECLDNERKVRKLTRYIMKKIEFLGYSKSSLEKQGLKFPFLLIYYKKVSSLYGESFKLGDEHIPAIFVLEILRLYSEKGFSEFKRIDFLKYQGYFESYHARKKGLIPKHFKTALNVANGMDSFKIKRKK